MVQGDPAQIEHLVAHLHRYSLNAMPKGGAVEVGARCVEGDAVKLWVMDSGGGISPELRERIFDPFFSTKDSPGQVGLGLSATPSPKPAAAYTAAPAPGPETRLLEAPHAASSTDPRSAQATTTSARLETRKDFGR